MAAVFVYFGDKADVAGTPFLAGWAIRVIAF